jgi:hypothetical protein
MIEKAHQPWKREKKRTLGVKNCVRQQKCQLRIVRKRCHYKIRLKMEEVANKRRQVFRSNTSSTRAENKATTVQEQKVEKRKDPGMRTSFSPESDFASWKFLIFK